MRIRYNVGLILRCPRLHPWEAFQRALLQLANFFVAIARRSIGHERVDQMTRDVRHVIHRLVEQRFGVFAVALLFVVHAAFRCGRVAARRRA